MAFIGLQVKEVKEVKEVNEVKKGPSTAIRAGVRTSLH
jgi:hypothetical protein